MKKISFLIKLNKENKLEIVEASPEVSESYLKKSESHFESSKILMHENKLEESVSMAYFGMYHSLLALLFRCGIKCENHSACIILLKELFQEDNLEKEISSAKAERIDKQYYTDFSINKKDCENMLKTSENFIFKIKSLIKSLNKEKIDTYREELSESLE